MRILFTAGRLDRIAEWVARRYIGVGNLRSTSDWLRNRIGFTGNLCFWACFGGKSELGYIARVAAQWKARFLGQGLSCGRCSCGDRVEEVLVTFVGRSPRHAPVSVHGRAASRATHVAGWFWRALGCGSQTRLEQQLEPVQSGLAARVQEPSVAYAVQARGQGVLEETADQLDAVDEDRFEGAALAVFDAMCTRSPSMARMRESVMTLRRM